MSPQPTNHHQHLASPLSPYLCLSTVPSKPPMAIRSRPCSEHRIVVFMLLHASIPIALLFRWSFKHFSSGKMRTPTQP